MAASIEKDVAEDIARRIEAEAPSDGVVCAFHLRSILLACRGASEAARLLLSEARLFERVAKDMQKHVLKREAFQRQLATRSERAAAETGLARLVGLRNTVSPWRIQ